MVPFAGKPFAACQLANAAAVAGPNIPSVPFVLYPAAVS